MNSKNKKGVSIKKSNLDTAKEKEMLEIFEEASARAKTQAKLAAKRIRNLPLPPGAKMVIPDNELEKQLSKESIRPLVKQIKSERIRNPK